jgi:hypothetical protein
MDGRQHKVAGDSSLHGNFGGLGISDLTDHNNVRILPQDGTQVIGKGYTRFIITCAWLMPARAYSTGSSTVMMFCSAVLISLIAVYRVVVLPLPVGPVTSSNPWEDLIKP